MVAHTTNTTGHPSEGILRKNFSWYFRGGERSHIRQSFDQRSKWERARVPIPLTALPKTKDFLEYSLLAFQVQQLNSA